MCEKCENKAVLYSKIAQVMGDLRRVRETGRHEKQRWRYATAEDVKDSVRGAMAKAGLALLINLEEYEIVPLKDKGILLRGRMAFTLCCADSGATETMYLWGEATDQAWVSDKAFYKLYTTLTKYFLKTIFLISSGDDPDSDADDVSQARPDVVAPHHNAPKSPPNGNGEAPKSPPNGNGEATKRAFEAFLGRTRIELGLSEGDTKAILRELGHTAFLAEKAEMYFEALNGQLNESVSTETSLFVLVNRETDNYYKHLKHLRNSIAKVDPEFQFPPAADEFTQWQMAWSMLVDHAVANAQSDNAQLQTNRPGEDKPG
jgi:hypothetical protein